MPGLNSPSTVVVGVNGTAASLSAARLGGREAVSRGHALRIVHAFTWSNSSEARRDALRIVDGAVASVQRSTPGARVTGELVDGAPDQALVRLSRTASLVVIGDDDLATTPYLPPGVPLVQVTARAFCPVAIARSVRPAGGPVVAAVDGSAPSFLGLAYAADEARRRHAALEVVHVITREEDEDRGRDVLAAAVAAVPDLGAARTRLLVGDPGPTLVRLSRQARMIVAGPRGRDGAGLLGSTARQVLHRGACPTVFPHGLLVPAPRVPTSESSPAMA